MRAGAWQVAGPAAAVAAGPHRAGAGGGAGGVAFQLLALMAAAQLPLERVDAASSRVRVHRVSELVLACLVTAPALLTGRGWLHDVMGASDDRFGS